MFLGVSCGMCVIRAITIGLYWVPVIASEPIVFDLPALAYFFGYSILVFDFADQYHGEKYKEEADRLSNNTWSLKTYFPWVTSLVCGAWVVLALVKLVASLHAKHPVFLVQVVSAAFIVLISTAAVIAFLVYGCLLLNKRQEFSEEFKRFRNILLIGSINIFGSIFFAIRMWVHGIITVFPDDQRLHPLPVFAFGLILAEIIFAILLLFIFWELPPTYKRLLDRDTADVA